jgi:hypothetical protein
MRADAGADPLESAISGMQALKTEHAPILAQIARDAGMSPETRATLIAHLLEEEDEKLARIAAAAGLGAPLTAGAAHGMPAASSSASRLTVGSLRTPSSSTSGVAGPTSTPDPAARRTVGSLRAR